ncbi:SDR family oxidoreductase [Haliangium sp.]|uniref:SDR family oxidoreductase n=1 Tax=Haliangium sp. TaxID=2663208 RepID=UPI003D0A35F7
MRPDLSSDPDRPAAARSALVLGGTGAIGSAVLARLAARGVAATFTYHEREDRARALASEYDQRPIRADLADTTSTAALFEALDADPDAADIDVLIHCAGIAGQGELEALSPAAWRALVAVNAESALWAVRWLSQRRQRDADVVLVGALDRTQSLPLPVGFAATQGMLPAMAMAMAHELGPRDYRVNVVSLGFMDAGLSAALAGDQRRDYERFSALRRAGRPDEAAAAIAWLALENRTINGKVISVNGGVG